MGRFSGILSMTKGGSCNPVSFKSTVNSQAAHIKLTQNKLKTCTH